MIKINNLKFDKIDYNLSNMKFKNYYHNKKTQELPSSKIIICYLKYL